MQSRCWKLKVIAEETEPDPLAFEILLLGINAELINIFLADSYFLHSQWIFPGLFIEPTVITKGSGTLWPTNDIFRTQVSTMHAQEHIFWIKHDMPYPIPVPGVSQS